MTWTDLVGASPYSTDESLVISGTTGGTTYQFRVRARNIYGWGDWSDAHSVKAADTPDQMAALTTSVDATTGDVKIEWSEPHDGSQTITSYSVQIQKKDLSWYTDTDNCDGSQAAIMAQLYCTIPMATLTGATYSLALNDEVFAKALATNSYGNGLESPVNSEGAYVKTIPAKMSNPYNTTKSTTSITMEWAEPSETDSGNATITSYTLLWNNGGTGTPTTTLTDSLVTSYTISGLTAGQSYIFKVRANNIYGPGDYSDEVTVEASDVPVQMDPPTVTIPASRRLSTADSSTNVRVAWSLLTTSGQTNSNAINGYEVMFQHSDGSWVEAAACPALDLTAMTNGYCEVAMADLPTLLGLT